MDCIKTTGSEICEQTQKLSVTCWLFQSRGKKKKKKESWRSSSALNEAAASSVSLSNDQMMERLIQHYSSTSSLQSGQDWFTVKQWGSCNLDMWIKGGAVNEQVSKMLLSTWGPTVRQSDANTRTKYFCPLWSYNRRNLLIRIMGGF